MLIVYRTTSNCKCQLEIRDIFIFLRRHRIIFFLSVNQGGGITVDIAGAADAAGYTILAYWFLEAALQEADALRIARVSFT